MYLLSCEEEQDVPLASLAHVDLDDGADGRLQVVPLWLRRVEDLHGVRASGDGQQRTLVEIHLELAGVERGAHDDDLEGNGERKTNFTQKRPPLPKFWTKTTLWWEGLDVSDIVCDLTANVEDWNMLRINLSDYHYKNIH